MTINGMEIPGVLIEQFRSGHVTKQAFLEVLALLRKSELERVVSAVDDRALREIQDNVKYLERLKDFFEKLLTPTEK